MDQRRIHEEESSRGRDEVIVLKVIITNGVMMATRCSVLIND